MQQKKTNKSRKSFTKLDAHKLNFASFANLFAVDVESFPKILTNRAKLITSEQPTEEQV